MIRVLIAEDNVPISVHLSNVINFTKEAQAISIVNNGKEVYAMIKSLKPDVVILDLKLPDEDRFEILQKIEDDKEINTQIIVTYSGRTEYLTLVQKFKSVVSIFDNSIPCEQIGLEVEKIARKISHNELEKKIYDILLKMGFHAEHKGTHYLKECILISSEENKENLKEIYEKISNNNRIATYTIKADIQGAVNKMWRYTNKEKVKKILRLGEYETPSTKRVVSMVKYYIESF